MPQLDPVIWFFVLGFAAGVARADLRLPAAIYEFVKMRARVSNNSLARKS